MARSFCTRDEAHKSSVDRKVAAYRRVRVQDNGLLGIAVSCHVESCWTLVLVYDGIWPFGVVVLYCAD